MDPFVSSRTGSPISGGLWTALAGVTMRTSVAMGLPAGKGSRRRPSTLEERMECRKPGHKSVAQRHPVRDGLFVGGFSDQPFAAPGPTLQFLTLGPNSPATVRHGHQSSCGGHRRCFSHAVWESGRIGGQARIAGTEKPRSRLWEGRSFNCYGYTSRFLIATGRGDRWKGQGRGSTRFWRRRREAREMVF